MRRLDLRVVGGVLLAVAAFALATTAIEDTDAWTHLALGRDLVQRGAFPATEPFTFPAEGRPYENGEWLFGVVLYLAYLAAGSAGVVLLKAAVVAGAFAVLFRDAVLPRGPDDPAAPARDAAIALLATAGALLMARHRFVERPDVALMLFLALTVHALNRYLDTGRARWLWILPPVQLVWVNMHASIVVGAVPYLAVLAGGALQRRITGWTGVPIPGTPTPAQVRAIGLVFAGVIAVSFVNPHGVEPFVTPFRLMNATWLRHEVIELQPPDLRHYPGVAVALVALAALVVARWRRPALVTVLLVVPFAYLALSARRFVFLLAIVSAPVVARAGRDVAARWAPAWQRRLTVPLAAAALLVTVGPPALVVAGAPGAEDPFRVPGLGVNLVGVPEGALRYLDRAGVEGRVFNVFHWGGYITWRDFPRRRPFVDGRGSLPPGLLDEMMAVRADVVRLERLRARYGFDVAIVDYPRNVMSEETPDVDLGLASPDWALVYWDDLALVYLRRTPALGPLIARDEYRAVKPAMGAGHLRRRLADPARARAIEHELRRNAADTGSSTAWALLGFALNELGQHDRAIEALGNVRDFPLGSNILNAELALGFAYTRLGDLGRALHHYERALARDEDPLTLHNTGLVLERLGRDADAARRFERALEKDPRLAPVYPALMRVAGRLGREARVRELERGYAAALARAQAEAHFKRGVKLYFEGQLEAAASEFQRSLKTHARNAATRSNLGFVYFDLGRLDAALAEQRTALDIDDAFSNAHYGLALIHRRRGEDGPARDHFARYLRLAPTGYWARRAQTALTELAAR